MTAQEAFAAEREKLLALPAHEFALGERVPDGPPPEFNPDEPF